MAPPERGGTSDIAYYLIYRPQKDERLSWPSWLTYSGRLTHISGHPSAVGRAWDRKVRQSKTNVLPLCHAANHHIAFDKNRKILPQTTKNHKPLNTRTHSCLLCDSVVEDDIKVIKCKICKDRFHPRCVEYEVGLLRGRDRDRLLWERSFKRAL